MANDLQQLAQLLQIANSAQAPQFEARRLQGEEDNRRAQQALQLMGLQQQGRQSDLRNQLEQGSLAETARHNQADENAVSQNARLQRETQAFNAMEHFGGPTGEPNPMMSAILRSMFPEIGSAMDQAHATAIQQAFAQNKDSVGGLKGSGAPDPVAFAALMGLHHVPPEAQEQLKQYWMTQHGGSQASTAPHWYSNFFGGGGSGNQSAPSTGQPQAPTTSGSADTASRSGDIFFRTQPTTVPNFDAQGNPTAPTSQPGHIAVDWANLLSAFTPHLGV